jgi:DOPA 4,5-dioxygenase
MSDPFAYAYPSPLEGYENLTPLPDEKAADGKSYVNPPAKDPSAAYSSFSSPISNDRRGGFDVHVYFECGDQWQVKYATDLWERIRRECEHESAMYTSGPFTIKSVPELRIYRVWDRPIGPHPVGMFEVNIFTPCEYL